ncbi:subtilisin-like protein [Lactarius psammicola]|nr:subtilisin-like protein [Lactarius psammicola]
MLYHWHPLSMFSFLASGLLHGLATPLEPRWDSVTVRTKHAWDAVPEHWETLGHPPAGTTIDLHIALKPQHENALIDKLYEVSTPRSQNYGEHLSKEQVAELVAPHPDTLRLVNSWLEHHGVRPSSVSRSHGGGWLTVVDVPMSQANNLLSASYQLYWHAKTNETIIRTISYGLPAELHSHVTTVAPTTYFSSPRMLRHTPHIRRAGTTAALAKSASAELGRGLSRTRPRNDDDDDDDIEDVTPSFLRWLYNTLGYAPAATDRNVLGVVGFLRDYPSQFDLTKFMREYRTDGEDATFTVVEISGDGSHPEKPTPEGNLDTQYTESIAYPTPHTYYSTGGKEGTVDPYLNWLNYMTELKKLPQTVSTSYGGFEDAVPLEFAKSACKLYAQLGSRGATILFSTGDFGAGQVCTGSSGNTRFRTRFPATCPWVTSVGGTIKHEPEVAAQFSGGGFSNHFPRPPYQDEVVATYLRNLGGQYSGLYNPAGRGIPDISAQAHKFEFIHYSDDFIVSGTSCAVPTAAGIISLLNDYRISNGQAALGFLNPLLYSYGIPGINDITSGTNSGCSTNGFSASVGWDPATGLGTLDFMKLEEILEDLMKCRIHTSQPPASQTSASQTQQICTAY